MRTNVVHLAFVMVLSAVFLVHSSISVPSGERGPTDVIDIPFTDSSVTVDGKGVSGEWTGSGFKYQYVNGTTLTLNFMQNRTHLFLLFRSNGVIGDVIFADVIFDREGDFGSMPDEDDLWLVNELIAGSPKEMEGGGPYPGWGVLEDPSGWTVATSFMEIEYSISFEKLNVTKGTFKTMGFSFLVQSQLGYWVWPEGSNSTRPDTWGSIFASERWGGAEPPPNLAPSLSGVEVDPPYGFIGDIFTFEVEYSDPEYDPAVDRSLFIDGVEYDMDWEMDTFSGSLYTIDIELEIGEHSHYYVFSDGKNSTRLPVNGTFEGPTVYSPNSPPYFENGGIPNGTFGIEEDSVGWIDLLDLEEFFGDDRDDGNLSFRIVRQEDPDILSASMNGSVMRFMVSEENWNGQMEFQVEATDRGIEGLPSAKYSMRTLSNPFRIGVIPKNDLPELLSIGEEDVHGRSEFIITQRVIEDVPFSFEVRGRDVDMATDSNERIHFGTNESRISIVQTGDRAAMTFVPDDIDVGVKWFSVTLTDQEGGRDEISVVMRIDNVNDVPSIRSVTRAGKDFLPENGIVIFEGSDSAVQDEPFRIAILAEDPDLVRLDELLTFDLENPRSDVQLDVGTGILIFTPDHQDVGQVRFNIKVADLSGASDRISIIIDVMDVNDPPVIEGIISSTGSFNFTEGCGDFLTISVTDADLGYVIGEELSILWTSDIDGIVGTGQRLDVTGLSPGIHNITVEVSDTRGSTVSYILRIEVRPNVITTVDHVSRLMDVLIGIAAAALILSIGLALVVSAYTRLNEKEVLDNMNRKAIFEAVKKKPGIHFMAMSEDLGLAIGVLSHHLNILEKSQIVKSMQDGKYRRFYLYDERVDFKLRLTEIQQSIVFIVKQDPGITQRGIAERMGKNKMVVNYHVKILKDVGLLAVERNGRETNLFPTYAAMNLS